MTSRNKDGRAYPSKVRALFLSDLHLGYWVGNGRECCSILDEVQAEQIYLVGDVIDEVRLARRWCWASEDQRFVDRLSDLRQAGVQVFILPGNHDPCLGPRGWPPHVASLERCLAPWHDLPRSQHFFHQLLDGRRLLVMHGDQCDPLRARENGVPQLGSRVFDGVSYYWPRACVLGLRRLFKFIMTRPNAIEQAVIEYARSRGVDGVLYGHMHHPCLRQDGDFLVVNCGDWVEHRSFVVESLDGELMLFDGRELIARCG